VPARLPSPFHPRPTPQSDRFNGHTLSLEQNGILMFTIVIITVHAQLGIVLDQWTWMHHAAMWGSIGAHGRGVGVRGRPGGGWGAWPGLSARDCSPPASPGLARPRLSAAHS
jgi:hypothetical protein